MRGVVSAGFKTTVFPQAKAGAIFHAAMSNGKFHGMICPATPNGRGFRPGKGILQFIGPTGVVEKVRRHQRQIDIATLPDWLPAVHGLQHRQLPGPSLDETCDAEEELPPFPSRQLAPDALIRLP